jgi:hypothetical protein
MNESPAFEKLVVVAKTIAQAPPLPGDRKSICRCVQCIDDFYYKSRITFEQWEALRDILLNACA